MKKTIFFSLLVSIALLGTSCNGGDDIVIEKDKGSYVIVANTGSGSYLLQTDNLKDASLTTQSKGIETAIGTNWVNVGTDYLYRLVYAQGSSGTGSSYEIGLDSIIKERSQPFEITNRYTTFGVYKKYVLTGAGVTLAAATGETVQQKGFAFTILDAEQQTMYVNTVSTENFLGTGENCTFVGFAEANNKIYTAVCPQGYSDYAVDKGFAEAATTSTAYPDSVFVAVFDNINFTNPTIIRSNKLGAAYGQYRSMRHSNILTDDKSNVYVFSSSAGADQNPSGVLRINSGTTEFDSNFFFDIETATSGLPLFRAFHVTGDLFVVQLFATDERTNDTGNKYAIFNASGSGSLTMVTGLPEENITSSSTYMPLVDDGVFYFPMKVEGEQVAIWSIDPSTAKATKGTTVDAEGISAIVKLEL